MWTMPLAWAMAMALVGSANAPGARSRSPWRGADPVAARSSPAYASDVYTNERSAHPPPVAATTGSLGVLALGRGVEAYAARGTSVGASSARRVGPFGRLLAGSFYGDDDRRLVLGEVGLVHRASGGGDAPRAAMELGLCLLHVDRASIVRPDGPAVRSAPAAALLGASAGAVIDGELLGRRVGLGVGVLLLGAGFGAASAGPGWGASVRLELGPLSDAATGRRRPRSVGHPGSHAPPSRVGS